MIRLSAEERAMLEALSQVTGLSLSDAARQAIRADVERRGLKVKVPKSRRE